jgi:lactobin A/cerein 7B family class IIb bacteriocin
MDQKLGGSMRVLTLKEQKEVNGGVIPVVIAVAKVISAVGGAAGIAAWFMND